MNKDNLWVLIGMAVYAVLAGTFGALGIIALGPGQHITTAGVFVVIIFIFSIITGGLNRVFAGMTLLSLAFGIFTILLPGQQFAIAGILAVVITAVLIFRSS